ncbi:hypothetical protein ABC347_07805 [Sphingomonas sp. 1P06PA]|uniref:hypothetical protein n=1 Tax=Sphingomonas sp. 1P06PA TaxID=554121 RepID=UPI0039A40087
MRYAKFGSPGRKAYARAASTGLRLSGNQTAVALNSSAAFTPTIAGGLAPFTMTLASGALPTGRSIVGLSVTGTHSGAGTFNYTLRVTDARGGVATLPVGPVVVS